MRRSYSGNAKKTYLSLAIDAAAMTISAQDLSGFPTGASGPFFIVISKGFVNEEKILCTSRATNTITVTSRGADDTSAAAHSINAPVEHVFTALDADEANGHVNTPPLHIVTATSAARPAAPIAGQVIYETDTTNYMGWNGSAWVGIGDSSFDIINAKGDLIVGTADNTAGILSVGANETVLTADSTTATGTKWAASSGGGGGAGLQDVFLLMGA
jgi:hypothetical protein|tara:strand:+ start:364 stop:1008 length:645 start_codon:yes stop_codon:yes gene_type:complete